MIQQISWASDGYPFANSKSDEFDKQKKEDLRIRCEYLKILNIKGEFPVDCFTNYHHFGAANVKKIARTNIKIANYNLLHPGTSKALYKDYRLVAKIMNSFDVVAALELLNTVGQDEQHNRGVISYLQNTPLIIKSLDEQRSKITDAKQIELITKKIEQLTKTTQQAYDIFRNPGYLNLLYELKKLDPAWSLVLSPRGDSALIGSVEEFTGFYYRASVVSPDYNPHCHEFLKEGEGYPFACFANLSERFMGQDLAEQFARRPFLASFKVNNSRIHLVASHIVFTFSGDDEKERELMQKTFGVNSYRELSMGINMANFARFAEIKNTLDFMNRFKLRYNDDKIMYMGDTNISASSAFWPEVLKSFPGSSVQINTPTTLSPQRYTALGKATNGLANDYDHFIFNKQTFSNCAEAEVYNYYLSPIAKDLDSRYVIREAEALWDRPLMLRPVTMAKNYTLHDDFFNEDETIDGDLPPIDDPTNVKLDYPLSSQGQSKMDKMVNEFKKKYSNVYTIKRDQIVVDDYMLDERVEGYRRRVFLRQLTNGYYYRFVQELLSDHFPISISCKF